MKRVEKVPELICRPINPGDLDLAIPKMHIEDHGEKCKGPYSLNFKRGAGRVDGEGIERCWAMLNGVSKSTRLMGPGSRKDTIEDHCSHANWRKAVKMGMSVVKLPCNDSDIAFVRFGSTSSHGERRGNGGGKSGSV
jgi:hypothetical protein